jgi:hypothetical protein
MVARVLRRWAVSTMVVVHGVASASVAVASHNTELPLTVTVYDYAGLLPETREDAATIVTRIYAAVGVEMVWLDGCLGRECDSVPQRASGCGPELTVHIVSRRMTPRQLKASVMGVAPSGSFMVYAYFDRIREFAFRRSNIHVPTLLGHVIAHEMGHLLLRQGHAAHGIMRASWSAADLSDAMAERLRFTTTEGERIRAQVAQMHVTATATIATR